MFPANGRLAQIVKEMSKEKRKSVVRCEEETMLKLFVCQFVLFSVVIANVERPNVARDKK